MRKIHTEHVSMSSFSAFSPYFDRWFGDLTMVDFCFPGVDAVLRHQTLGHDEGGTVFSRVYKEDEDPGMAF